MLIATALFLVGISIQGHNHYGTWNIHSFRQYYNIMGHLHITVNCFRRYYIYHIILNP